MEKTSIIFYKKSQKPKASELKPFGQLLGLKAIEAIKLLLKKPF